MVKETKKDPTIEGTREKVERALSADKVDDLSDEDIVELYRLYRLSAPIRIPVRDLDSNYEYRWINKKDEKNFRRRKGVGWKPVTRELLEKFSKVPLDELNMGTNFAIDGTLVISDDLVLAYIPKRIAQVIRAAREKSMQDALGAGKRRFHEAGKLAGVETFEKF